MTRTRISLLLGVVGVMGLVACSSDEPSSTTGDSTNSSTEGSSESSTTVTAGSTATTDAPADESTTSTTGVAAATTTAVSRVVTDPSDNVRPGDSGDGVSQIQYALVANGYKIPVDGQYGPVTETAVRDFQKKNGLTIDGVVGPITWSRLAPSVGVTTTSGASETTTAPTEESTASTTG